MPTSTARPGETGSSWSLAGICLVDGLTSDGRSSSRKDASKLAVSSHLLPFPPLPALLVSKLTAVSDDPLEADGKSSGQMSALWWCTTRELSS